MPQSKCLGCGQKFASTALFDQHRIGRFERYEDHKGKWVLVQPRTRRCMTDEEKIAIGMRFDEKTGLWLGPPMSEEELERLGRRKKDRQNLSPDISGQSFSTGQEKQ